MNGGTLVTNFSEDLDVYEEAVREYGDPRILISVPAEPHMPGAKGLHDLRGKRRPDLSGFWMLWRCIKAERLPDPATADKP